jgi:hypothetical protein
MFLQFTCLKFQFSQLPPCSRHRGVVGLALVAAHGSRDRIDRIHRAILSRSRESWPPKTFWWTRSRRRVPGQDRPSRYHAASEVSRGSGCAETCFADG